MDGKTRKKKTPRWLQIPVGYGVGTLSWLLGMHCLEGTADGRWAPSARKTARHLWKVLGWTVGLVFFCHGFHRYFLWLMDADAGQKFLALLGKSVLFLYIRFFWPGLLTKILPGVRDFFCPQCYHHRTFRFLPVSSKFGNGVTYLCPHCSCLVDGWGGQIFYPEKGAMGQGDKGWLWVPAAALLVLGAGIYLGEVLIKLT
jgi:hypothetical protein